MGAFYKGFLVFVVGLPVILPLLFIPNLDTATLVSGVIAIAILGILGWIYAKYTFRNRFLLALGVTLVGVAIVAVTIILEG